MYIHKGLGAYICHMKIPVINVGRSTDAGLEISVYDTGSGNSDAGSLCHSLSKMLDRNMHVLPSILSGSLSDICYFLFVLVRVFECRFP